VGLGLDYDIFLLTRIYELRGAGYADRDAIGHGLVLSGNVISAAGVIMAVAFTGLFMTPTVAVNQLGFALVAAVTAAPVAQGHPLTPTHPDPLSPSPRARRCSSTHSSCARSCSPR